MASRSGRAKKPYPRPARPTFMNRLALTVTPAAGGRARVVAVGEIDLDSAADLRRVLDAALQASTRLEIDLGRVSFCDCSGLHVLMDVCHKALSLGQTMAVIDTSPCVRRLLDLTGTLDAVRIAPPDEADSDPLHHGRSETAVAETGG
ncbi:STAS domain-containing protein [Streptomyces sp. NPDC005408]|uniref:STAS domain-containing protein n=1 Tax=Streptomyces sp. NPDC005408 TaxID=3155341 RepID=UPI0033A0E28C